jgi:hypothetical protein
VTQQPQKSIDFRRIELYDFHLWIPSILFSSSLLVLL